MGVKETNYYKKGLEKKFFHSISIVKTAELQIELSTIKVLKGQTNSFSTRHAQSKVLLTKKTPNHKP